MPPISHGGPDGLAVEDYRAARCLLLLHFVFEFWYFGFPFSGFGFRIWVFGFWGSEFGVHRVRSQDSGFRVQGLNSTPIIPYRLGDVEPRLGFQGLGFGEYGVQGSGVTVWVTQKEARSIGTVSLVFPRLRGISSNRC